MREIAAAYTAVAGATDWETEAFATLLSMADAIQPDSEGGYIDGHHRAQVMLEAGVHRTVVLCRVYAD